MDQGQRRSIKKARAFYSERGVQVRCVVTEKENPQWHHLDEANPRRWHYTNIIPLDGNLNQQLDKRKHRHLPMELTPAFLEAKGFEHYRYGKFVQGYACDRLASYLMCPPRGDVAIGFSHDPSKSLQFASYALLNLRPISALECATDTLWRNVIPILSSSSPISKQSAARLVAEIDCYYRDYGLPYEGIECCDLARHLLSDDPALLGDETRVIQHKGIALAAVGDKKQSSDLLDRSRDALAAGALYEEGNANYALWKSRLELSSPRPNLDYCRRFIRIVYDLHEKGRTGIWTYAEAVWTLAEIEFIGGHKSKSDEILLQGRDLFYRTGVVPTANLPPKSVRHFNERYPKDLYVLPRTPQSLGKFRRVAQSAISIVRKRLQDGELN